MLGHPGTLYRFIDVVQQLGLTYDLYSMTGDQILQLLPSEFDRWRQPFEPVRKTGVKLAR